jgi:hypothetical protein
MSHKIHFRALLGLVITLIVVGIALYVAWTQHSTSPVMHQMLRPRAWTTPLGDLVSAIVIIGLFLCIWLAHKAFFSRRP